MEITVDRITYLLGLQPVAIIVIRFNLQQLYAVSFFGGVKFRKIRICLILQVVFYHCLVNHRRSSFNFPLHFLMNILVGGNLKNSAS